MSRTRFLLPSALLLGVAAALFTSRDAGASDDAAPLLGPGIGPDVIVGDIYDIDVYTTANGESSYSFGTESCNIGDEVLDWIANTNDHPVIAQNLYRLKDGRFEQIGMSWLKHGFTALNGGLCGSCQSTPGNSLGIGCSDPYSAFLNGFQSDLGPRSDINAYTGLFPYPPTLDPPFSGGIARRLVVDNVDVDPALNPNARYFVECHYIHQDDNSATGNGANNMSYREVSFSGSAPPFNCSFVGATQRERSAVEAWQAADPAVTIVDVDVPNDGNLFLAYKVTDNGDGTWEYHYVLYNKDSHRGARGFAIPLTNTVNLSDKFFRDVDHHSGEIYSTADWMAVDTQVAGGQRVMAWLTGAFNANPNSNALRWSSSFSFSVTADTPPVPGQVLIAPFRPGTPRFLFASAQIPG